MNTEEDTLDFIEESLGTIQGLEEKNKELTAKLAELKEANVELEKVASELQEKPQTTELSHEKIKSVVDSLVKFSYINPLYADQVTEKIASDPNTVLELLEKVSEASVALPSSGRGIAKEASEADEVDPDGWTSLRRGNR